MKTNQGKMASLLKILKLLATLFMDHSGDLSQKRVIPLCAFVILARIAILSTSGGHVSEPIVYTLGTIILGGIGLTLPEWWSKKSTFNKTEV